MSQIDPGSLKNWQNGETITAELYKQEREILYTAINDNWARLIKQYFVLNSDGSTKTTQSLGTAINYMRFRDTSSIQIALDNTTSTLTFTVVDGAVSTTKIADGAITTLKLADLNVTTGKLADSAVTALKLAADAVTTVKILDGNVTETKLASNSVTTNKIADGAVTTDKIANGTITNTDISDTAGIGWSKVSKTGSSLADLATRNASDLTSGTLNAARLPAFTGDITTTLGSSNTTLSTTGVIASTYKSVTVDAKGRVTAGTNPTTLSGYGITDAASSSDLNTHKTSADHDGRYYTETELNNGQLDNRYYTETEINSKVSVDYGAIASVNNVANATGNINLIGGYGITITASDSLNEIEITATGTSTPGAHAGTHSWDSTIDPLPTSSINTAQLVDGSVTNEKLDENAVEVQNIAADAVTTVKILDGNVTETKLASNSVTSAKLASSASVDADRSVTTNHIKDNAVTSAKLASSASVDADRSVTTNHIKDNAVTSAKIQDLTIINGDISATAAIDATKIGDGSVTNTEFQYINSVTSNVQTQLNNKFDKSGGSLTGALSAPSLTASTGNITATAGNVVVGSTNITAGGAVSVALPSTAGTLALTSQLPTVNNGTLSLSTSGVGLTGSGSFTANQSGNSTFTVTSNATSANTASTIVSRDANGDFSAGTITLSDGLTVNAGNVSLKGTSTQSALFDYGATQTISVKYFDANNVVLDTSTNQYNYIGTSAKRFWRGYFDTLDALTVDANKYVGLPVATTSLSGIVSTGTQTFAGSKTFNSALSLNGDNRASGTTGSRVHNFYNTATSSIAGGITITGSATVTYGQGSDYRLKENFEPLTGALNKLLSIPVYKFSWKSEPEKGKVDGFIAHEVQEFVPEAIVGKKDAVDEEGNPIYQQIDQSKLVPLLFKAVQELTLKVKELESKLN